MKMFLQEEKLQRRIAELAHLRYKNKRNISTWQVQEDVSKSEKIPPQHCSDKTDMHIGDIWQGRDHYLWLQAEVMLPKECNVCFFDFGKTGGGGNSGFEALLYIDGLPVQGIDSNHKEYILRPSEVGRKVTLSLKLWSGLEGGGEPRVLTHTLNQAFFGELDHDTNAFYTVSKMLLETYQQFAEDHEVKYQLLGVLTEAWRLVDWRMKALRWRINM